MKIIKQNDSAGGLLFKQNTNGKAMKQNYNFGKSFFKGASTNCYIDAPYSPNFQSDFSIINWFRANQTSSPFSSIFLIRDISNRCFLTSYRVNVNKTLLSGLSYNSAFTPVISNIISLTEQNNISITAAVRRGSNLEQYSDSKTKVVTNSAPFYTDSISHIYFALSNATTGFNYAINRVNYCAVYERAISDAEFAYLNQNKLGNELLNVYKLFIFYKMYKAEILDFSALQDGSDLRVGVRDYSVNNRHGEIMNLPSGTLQEKTDYANANLFAPFIS